MRADPHLGAPRAMHAAIAWSAATVGLAIAERGVALSHGVATHGLSWSARAALLGLHGAIVSAIAVAIAIVWVVAARVGRIAAGVVAAAFVAIPCGVVGQIVAAGPWISQQWFAPVVAWAPAIVGAIAAIGLARWGWRRPRAITIGLVAIASVAAIADATIAIGHQPALHLCAWGIAATTVVLATLRVTVQRVAAAARHPGARGSVIAFLVLAIVALTGGVALARMDARTRAELLLRSPLARDVLRAFGGAPTSRLFAELRDLAPDRTTSAPVPAAADLTIDPTLNVLVVTIDALRADALPPGRTGAAAHAQAGDTPNLDAFAASAFAFRHAYAPASFTMRSLPAVFRSRPPFEDPRASGPSLPRVMADAGCVPLAVVDRHFIEEPDGRQLLVDFEEIDVHATSDMRLGVDQLLALIRERRDRRIFAWMHLFATHAPGYAGRPLGPRDGDWPARYRRSVQWVDTEIGRLLRALDREGLLEHTIVIVASDHGEGLGDNGVELHGETVFEEEIRVPLLVRIPGHSGGVIDATVGLVDLLPTLVDLAGVPPDPRHVGRSWRPLLADPSAPWPADVLSMSRRDGYALVRGRDKVVYDAKADALMRFDLRDDPTEEHDRFGDDPTLDAALASALVRAHPALFARELDDPRTHALLRERLREIDFAAPHDATEFLVRLVALAPEADLVAIVLDGFAPTDDATRLRIVEHLLPVAPAVTSAAIVAHLESVAGTARERDFAAALAHQSTPAFDLEHVATRLAWWNEHGDPLPWLELVRPWSKKSWTDFGGTLTTIAARDDAPPEILRAALAAAVGLTARDRTSMRPLADAALRHVTHRDASIRAAACGALVEVGTAQDLPVLRQALARVDEDIRVRQACLKAAAFAAGEDAVDLVIEQAADSDLTFYAIRLLETLRSPKAIAFLQETIAREKRGRIHAAATLALRLTEQRR